MASVIQAVQVRMYIIHEKQPCVNNFGYIFFAQVGTLILHTLPTLKSIILKPPGRVVVVVDGGCGVVIIIVCMCVYGQRSIVPPLAQSRVAHTVPINSRAHRSNELPRSRPFACAHRYTRTHARITHLARMHSIDDVPRHWHTG